MFIACSTQWRVIPTFSKPINQGIDYPSVVSVMQMYAVTDQRDVFSRLRLIERGAIAAMRNIPLETLIWPEPTAPAS